MKAFYAIAMAAVLLFSACSKNEPFFSAGEDDAPRILNTDIPEYGDDGQPGVIANLASDEAFTFTVIVTPARFTTVEWFIDDVKTAEGTTIDVLLPIGTHIGKVVATTTKGKSTSRTFRIIVS